MIQLFYMKKIVAIATFVLMSISGVAQAMIVGGVVQQHAIYKTSPGVLGASTTMGVPTGSLSGEQSAVILQGLKYAKKSDQIITTTLKFGMKGNEDIKTLQLCRIAKGYLAADPTGDYGGMTKAAVKKFQVDNGIVSDGSIVGPATRAAITKWIASQTK